MRQCVPWIIWHWWKCPWGCNYVFHVSQNDAMMYILLNCVMTKKPVNNMNTYLYIYVFLFFINAIAYLGTSIKHISRHCWIHYACWLFYITASQKCNLLTEEHCITVDHFSEIPFWCNSDGVGFQMLSNWQCKWLHFAVSKIRLYFVQKENIGVCDCNNVCYITHFGT